MNANTRIDQNHHAEIDRVREALGAIAAAEPAVFWLYRDADEHWSVRREGAPQEEHFDSREAAVSFMRVEAARCSAYRLLFVDADGRVREETHDWPTLAPDVAAAGH